MSEATAAPAPEAPAATPAVTPPPAARRFVLPDEPKPTTPPAAKPLAEGAAPAADAQKPTADQAPATAPEDKPEEVTPEQAAKREGRRFERRLDKAYRKAAEAQARADLAERQLAEARQAQTQPVDPGAPRLENFKDIEEYAAAKAKYESDKVLKTHQEKQRSEAQKQAHAKMLEGWESKVAKVEHEDFEEVVGDIKPTTPWATAIMKAENGAEVAYHLGKNIKEAQRIASLEPIDQILEIGKLAATLAAKPAEPKTPSKAPAPITPLTGATPVATDVPSERDDMKAWMRKRQKQVHGR